MILAEKHLVMLSKAEASNDRFKTHRRNKKH
jgi:hypothetical protein